MFNFFKNLSLNKKLTLAFTTIVLVPIIIMTLFSVRNVSQRIEENMEKRVQRTLKVSENVLQDKLDKALENAKTTAQLPSLQRYVLEKNILQLTQFVNIRREQLQATTLEIADKNGNILEKSYDLAFDPENKGDPTSRPILDSRQFLTQPQAPILMEAIRFRELTTIVSTKDGIILKGIVPIRNYDEPFGVVIIGYAINDVLVKDISKITGDETNISVYLKDRLIATSFEQKKEKEETEPEEEIEKTVAQTLTIRLDLKKHGKIFDRQLDLAEPILEVLQLGSKDYLVGHKIISDYQNEKIGMIAASVPYAEVEEVKRLSVFFIIIAGVVAFLMAILFAFRFARVITEPVAELVEGAKSVSAGNFNYQIVVKSRDEIGILGITFNQMTSDIKELINSLEKLNQVGVALSREHDLNKLLSIIVKEARELTKADAGNLYILRGKKLQFEISQYGTLDKVYSDPRKYFEPIALEITKGNIPGYVAMTGETVNIDDVYSIPEKTEFTFGKDFDERHGYRTKSMLAVPMMDKDEVIGVLQLMNVLDKGAVVPFGDENKKFAESLASQAAIAIKSSEMDKAVAIGAFGAENESLANSLASQAAVAIKNADLLQEITTLLFSVVKLSSYLIFARSKHTAGHTRRVQEYAMAIARTINESQEGKWKDYHFTYEELEELEIAGWMHDIGKVSIPESVLDKANKLSNSAMDAIDMRFQYIEQWHKAENCQKACENGGGKERARNLQESLQEIVTYLREDLHFIKESNIPGVTPVMTDDKIERLHEIADKKYQDIYENEHRYLNDFEVKNLSIRRGSLTDEERQLIMDHIVHTINILETIPFPKKWKNVPYIAGAHHEKLNGKGYPKGLTAEELNTQCRILAVADIFDALTSERPYKKGMPPDKAFELLENVFVKNGDIDGDIVKIFKESEAYKPILEKAKEEKVSDEYSIFQF